jgi:hypothetical protein
LIQTNQLVVRSTLIQVATLLGLVISSWLLFLYIQPVLPTVMQDELVYRQNLDFYRDDFFSAPNYLYFWVFSSVDLFGTQYYLASKGLNVFFHLCTSVLLLFWRGKQHSLGLRVSSSVLYFVSPFVAFTSFLMPEPLYALLVVVSLLFALEATKLSKFQRTQLACSGAVLALAQMVKPHAIFVFLAFVVYFALLTETAVKRQRLVDVLAIAAPFALVRIFVGLIIAGSQGLDLIGGYGDGIAPVLRGDGGEFPWPLLVGLVWNTVLNLGQHLAVTGVFLAPILFYWWTRRPVIDAEVRLVLTTIATVMFFIAAFESVITVVLRDDHLSRVLMRHYEFLFPILLLLFLRTYLRTAYEETPNSFGTALGQFGFVVFYVVVALTEGALWRTSNYSDSGLTAALLSPEARWTYVITGLLLFALLTTFKKSSFGLVSVLLTISLALPSISGLRTMHSENTTPTPGDLGAAFVVSNYPELKGEQILVIGSQNAITQAAVFQINKPGVLYDVYPAGTVLEPSGGFGDIELIFIFGEIILEGIDPDIASADDFLIYDLRE